MKAEWTNKDSLTSSETTKAVLVIDVPILDDGRHLCNECPIWNDERCFCEYNFNMKAKGCPLKPMPQKTGQKPFCASFQEALNLGWDIAIDTITGETE